MCLLFRDVPCLLNKMVDRQFQCHLRMYCHLGFPFLADSNGHKKKEMRTACEQRVRTNNTAFQEVGVCLRFLLGRRTHPPTTFFSPLTKNVCILPHFLYFLSLPFHVSFLLFMLPPRLHLQKPLVGISFSH